MWVCLCLCVFMCTLVLTCWGVWWCIWRPGSWPEGTSSRSPARPADARCSPRFLIHTHTHAHAHTHRERRQKAFYILHTLSLGNWNYTLWKTKGWDAAKSNSHAVPCTHTHTHTLTHTLTHMHTHTKPCGQKWYYIIFKPASRLPPLV